MKCLHLAAVFTAVFMLASCSETKVEVPEPFALTEEAIGRYCGMNVLEHSGPKGQIILDHIREPIWFSSARDAVAFTMLPEEPRNIAAVYVSDMAKASDWERPGAENWIDAHGAFFVIGSSLLGGMGAPETVPFSTQAAADEFAAEHGGTVVAFADIPEDYVLGGADENPPATEGMPPHADGTH